jgi:antitoxin component of MazEF toxin-antitoxin module
MKTKIKRIGNSKEIVISLSMLKALKLGHGDSLEIVLTNDKAIITKLFQPTSLEELFEGYESDYKPELIFDDEPQGREW